ncbi:MAG: hypothetical protein E7666_06270, partial [Ruminococcaceae bacterium]|nr:hypothetical protein [Oscillospiraceae bacterium]
MKTKTMRILSALLVVMMTVNALGTLSLTVSAAKRNPGTWGEITTEGVLSYADFSFRDGHEGTEEDPYEISTAAQLAGLAALVNAYDGSTVELTDAQGNTATATVFFKNGEKQHVKLTADIDLSEHGWMPIGMGSTNVFKGSFDGAGHTISGLSIESSEMTYAGLFGYVEGGTIKNVGVGGEFLLKLTSGNAYVGGLVGYASGSIAIENCYSTCNVSGEGVNSYTGGLVGGSDSSGKITITNSYNTGNVSATGKTNSNAGGLVGTTTSATITNCYNTGSVSSTTNAGGFVGLGTGITISNCYSACDVSGATAGGCFGRVGSLATVTDCYWYASDSALKPSGNGDTNGSPMQLSQDQMKAAAGATDPSWETIVISNSDVAGGISLVDALNAWVKQSNEETEAYREWHICSAAGTSVYPTYARYSYTDNGDGSTHKKQYECCEAVVDVEGHFGDVTVTCLGTVCEGCGAYYGATDSAHHVSTERVYRPDETEPYDYHNQHHACCGALIEDTQERHNDFTYTMEQINDSEQYVFTKTCLTCNGVVGKQYITVADRPYD